MKFADNRRSRPWWFILLGFWRTIPVLAAIGIGYAVGHPTAGAVLAVAFLVSALAFSRWARASQAGVRERLRDDPEFRRSHTERSDRQARAFGLYLASIG